MITLITIYFNNKHYSFGNPWNLIELQNVRGTAPWVQ